MLGFCSCRSSRAFRMSVEELVNGLTLCVHEILLSGTGTTASAAAAAATGGADAVVALLLHGDGEDVGRLSVTLTDANEEEEGAGIGGTEGTIAVAAVVVVVVVVVGDKGADDESGTGVVVMGMECGVSSRCAGVQPAATTTADVLALSLSLLQDCRSITWGLTSNTVSFLTTGGGITDGEKMKGCNRGTAAAVAAGGAVVVGETAFK